MAGQDARASRHKLLKGRSVNIRGTALACCAAAIVGVCDSTYADLFRRVRSFDVRPGLRENGRSGWQRAAVVEVNESRLSEATAVGGELRFNLFDDVALTGRVVKVMPTDGGVITTGELVGEPGSSFIAVVHGTAFAAEVRSPSRGDFEIRQIASGELVARQIDQSEFRPCGVGPGQRVGWPAPQGGDADGGVLTREQSQVRVLMAYTNAAVAGVGGIDAMNALINLGITQTNEAYERSGILITLEVAHRMQVEYQEIGKSATDLAFFRSIGDGGMDDVHSARDCTGSDLCALLVDKMDDACGIAYLLVDTTSSFAGSAFSVTDTECVSGFTLAHEFGHNMACQHDRANAGGAGAFPYGFGYRTPDQKYRTIMSYDPGQRIPYFSNPDASFQGYQLGVPIGNQFATHNAQVHNNVRHAAEAWRPPPVLADYNGDGFADAIDYDKFVRDWYASSMSADINKDGYLDSIDLDLFIGAFLAGCP